MASWKYFNVSLKPQNEVRFIFFFNVDIMSKLNANIFEIFI